MSFVERVTPTPHFVTLKSPSALSSVDVHVIGPSKLVTPEPGIVHAYLTT